VTGQRPAAALPVMKQRRGKGKPEVGDGADGRAPSVSGREGKRGAQVGRCGFMGRKGMWAAREKRKRKEGEREVGRR
jgi:hypothetical protein